MGQGAQGWFTGMTLRDRMGREWAGVVQDEVIVSFWMQFSYLMNANLKFV